MHKIVHQFNRRQRPLHDWFEGAVRPLGKHLAREKGLRLRLMGPFGLRCACIIVLYSDDKREPLYQEHWSITVMPHFTDEDTLELWHDTFRIVRDYPPNSIGALNDMGNELLPLPDTTAEILGLMRHNDGLTRRNTNEQQQPRGHSGLYP